MSDKPNRTIKVIITFAAADKPYREDYAPQTLVEKVLSDALAAFEIASDGTTRYYLLHEGAELALTSTLAEAVGRAGALPLKLRTETIQG